MRARCALVLALAAGACQKTVALDRIPHDASAKTILLIFGTRGSMSMAVLDLTADPNTDAADRSYSGSPETVWALSYAASPTELLLAPSAQAMPISGGKRPLPFTRDVFKASADGRSAHGWSPALLSDLDTVRIPAGDLSACMGCITGAADPSACSGTLSPKALCKTPCPAAAIAQPMAPSPPVPPTLTSSCTIGQICEDLPPAVATPCAFPTAQFFGAAACSEVDPVCPPPNGWRTDVAAPGLPIDYVRANAAPGGDGSQAAPHATIMDAVSAHPAGSALIALSDGTYEVPGVDLSRFAIWGACAGATEVVPQAGSNPTLSDPAEVRHLTVRTATHGWAIGTTQTVLVDHVILEGPGTAGIHAEGPGVVTATRTVIVDFDIGVFVDRGGQVNLFGSVVERASSLSLTLGAASVVGLDGVAIRNSEPFGNVTLSDGATLTATRADFAHDGQGIAVQSGSHVVLRRVFIRDTYEPTTTGQALSLQRGATADIEQISISGTAINAILAEDGATARIRGAIFARNGSNMNPTILALAGAKLSLERLWMEDNKGAGLIKASQNGARIEVEDAVLHRNTGGLAATEGAEISASRIDVSTTGQPDYAIWTVGQGMITLLDATVHSQDLAVLVSSGTITISRAQLSGLSAAIVRDGGRGFFDDITVNGSSSDHGVLEVTTGGRLETKRILISPAIARGVLLTHKATANISDLRMASPVAPSFEVGPAVDLVLEHASVENAAGPVISVSTCSTVQLGDISFSTPNRSAVHVATGTCSADRIRFDHFFIRTIDFPIDSGVVLTNGQFEFPGCKIATPDAAGM